MNNKFYTLFRKELLSIIRDRKSFLTFITMSIVMTPLLVGGLGLIQKFQDDQNAKEELVIAIKDGTTNQEMTSAIKSIQDIKIIETQNYEKDLENKKIKGYLEISEENGIIKTNYIYDQSSNASLGTSFKVQAIVQAFGESKRKEFLGQYNITEAQLNPVTFEQTSLQEIQNKPAQSSFVLVFLPYIILLGLIQGAAQFAIELTAGEKERNTLATTLSLNASRAMIGLSKISVILLLSLFSLVLNVASLIITFTLLPKEIIGGGTGPGDSAINVTPEMISQLFLVLIPLSFLVAALLVLLGTYARNQKEGGLYTLPLMLASIFIGLSGQAFDANTPFYIFLIPIVGHVALIKQVLLGSFIFSNFIISAIATFVLFLIMLYVSIKMYSKEEIIFRQ